MFRTQCVLPLVALLCVCLSHAWNIALSKGELLEFYINTEKITTVRLENQDLGAIAYDEVHNMILYVDKQSQGDAVCGYEISSMAYKCFTERNGRIIQGLAFDPTTELCFFSDTDERSINWFSLKSGSNNNVNVFIKKYNEIPTDIAVDICGGYIYWINLGQTTFTIERARMNGSERVVVIYSTSRSINPISNFEKYSIAIDQQLRKVFWVERQTNGHSMISSDLNGNNKKAVMNYTHYDGDGITYKFILTVSRNSRYLLDIAVGYVWEFPKIRSVGLKYNPVLMFQNESPVGIVANYKISEQIQGISECKKHIGLVRNLQYRITSSLCDNYCLQGKCSLNEDGNPECRCNAGYSGGRCELNACHEYCLNNGTCSLNEEEKPYCQCGGTYDGSRCETVLQHW